MMEIFWSRLGVAAIIFACLGGVALLISVARSKQGEG